MGLRMRKSIQICKGVKVNLGLKGASLSFGTKGLRHTIHTSGRKTTTVGIPGTGISYSKTHGNKKKQASSKAYQSQQSGQVGGLNAVKVEEYNNMVNTLQGLHKTCDEAIDWNGSKRGRSLTPGTVGPRQANTKSIKRMPGFFERLCRHTRAGA